MGELNFKKDIRVDLQLSNLYPNVEQEKTVQGTVPGEGESETTYDTTTKLRLVEPTSGAGLKVTLPFFRSDGFSVLASGFGGWGKGNFQVAHAGAGVGLEVSNLTLEEDPEGMKKAWSLAVMVGGRGQQVLDSKPEPATSMGEFLSVELRAYLNSRWSLLGGMGAYRFATGGAEREQFFYIGAGVNFDIGSEDKKENNGANGKNGANAVTEPAEEPVAESAAPAPAAVSPPEAPKTGGEAPAK